MGDDGAEVSMVGRGELTERAWVQIVPLLSSNGGRGKQWADHRRVINGILWKIPTHRCAVARPSGAARPLADVLRPVWTLATG